MEQKLMKLHVSPALHTNHKDVTVKLRELTMAFNDLILFTERHVPGGRDVSFTAVKTTMDQLWYHWENTVKELLTKAIDATPVEPPPPST